MWNFWNRLRAWIEYIVTPIYHVTFVGYVVVPGILYLVSYIVWPHLQFIFSKFTGYLPDVVEFVWFTSIANDQRVTYALLSALVLSPVAFYFLGRRKATRYRHAINTFRACLADHMKFKDAVSEVSTNSEFGQQQKQQQLSELARNHSIYLCSRVAEIFEMLTGHECHVSIKSFDPSNGLVTTRTRDVLAHSRERPSSDERHVTYKYDENTAFSKILDDENCYMFLSNWLRLRYFTGQYKNSNQAWRKFYVATVVVPITKMRSRAAINRDTVYGFICVDSKFGRFNRRSSRSILGLFAVLFLDVMLALGRTGSIPLAGGDKHARQIAA